MAIRSGSVSKSNKPQSNNNIPLDKVNNNNATF